MKLLLVTSLDYCGRGAAPVSRYVEAGRDLGHEVAVLGDPDPALPELPFTTEPARFDVAVFVIQAAQDFTDVFHLARALDAIPRQRRILIDLWGRFNDTVRAGDDSNHLEELDGHCGSEWDDAFRAVSDRIFQPTLRPRREGVLPFLFYGYDPDAVRGPHLSAGESARRWQRPRPFGLIYAGNNWQRWVQVRRLVEALAPLREKIGRVCLAGSDWDSRPDWAIQADVKGVIVEPGVLARLHVETRGPIRHDSVVPLLGRARFSPVLHRPLFEELGLVTNRTFETFCADTIPLLALPEEFIDSIHGATARLLALGDDPAARVEDALSRPEAYWEAILRTREHLARQHSYERRFRDLLTLIGH
jgi:hypothetical protein